MDERGRHSTDGGARRVAIHEWETVLGQLEQFCGSDRFDAEAGRATCEFANARLTVTADGTVEAGMPLHAFERAGVETLLFHHDRGEVIVETRDDDEPHLRYTFRRP